MAGSKENYFTELLDDYFAECEEHLMSVKRCLLALESSGNRQSVDELFRSFHTLKGLSGMVGFRDAEELCHNVESYLRALRDARVVLTPEGMDTMIAAAGLAEQVITAHRTNLTPPDITGLASNLRGLIHAPEDADQESVRSAGPSTEQLIGEKSEILRDALSRGARILRFVFTPLPELAERGINVNNVRERLQQIGELIQAWPTVSEDRKVAFEFLVATWQEEESFATWHKDGIVFSPFNQEPIVEPSGAEKAGEAGPGRISALHLISRNVVRVDLSRLDELVRVLGDLVTTRAHLEDSVKLLEKEVPARTWRTLQDISSSMDRRLRDLRDGIMRLRMVPVRDMFDKMRFAVRDLGRLQDKQVVLELQGEDTEVDKYIVERMMDPLLHLVRNAVGHGIETPDERVSAGKPPEGSVVLRASTAADAVQVEIEDDGRGIDQKAVYSKATKLGLVRRDESPDQDKLLEILSETGFTTIAKADLASGRGVGMAIVNKAVRELGGWMRLDTTPGQGTRFSIHLPLSLSIVNSIIVSAGNRTFAVPSSAVNEIIEIDPGAVTGFENNEMVPYREGVLPLLRLTRLFNIEPVDRRVLYGMVINANGNAVGIVVERLLGRREVVVRPLGDPLVQVRGVSGATELGDRSVVLILDVKSLAHQNG